MININSFLMISLFFSFIFTVTSMWNNYGDYYYLTDCASGCEDILQTGNEYLCSS